MLNLLEVCNLGILQILSLKECCIWFDWEKLGHVQYDATNRWFTVTLDIKERSSCRIHFATARCDAGGTSICVFYTSVWDVAMPHWNYFVIHGAQQRPFLEHVRYISKSFRFHVIQTFTRWLLFLCSRVGGKRKLLGNIFRCVGATNLVQTYKGSPLSADGSSCWFGASWLNFLKRQRDFNPPKQTLWKSSTYLPVYVACHSPCSRG